MPSIDVTPAQARALAELSAQVGPLALHQITPDDTTEATGDVYATPHGWETGYRVSLVGRVSPIGETLPAPD
ncbi:MAG TPA: hypothetical protein VE824_05125 [Gaiellales bacterium]|nr:hypothetical protein [Gaiellales bacterium]